MKRWRDSTSRMRSQCRVKRPLLIEAALVPCRSSRRRSSKPKPSMLPPLSRHLDVAGGHVRNLLLETEDFLEEASSFPFTPPYLQRLQDALGAYLGTATSMEQQLSMLQEAIGYACH